ncbi:MAG: helicase [Desulfobacter sp.]|nr:helicase [Desulfobacter sp.]
MPHLSEKYIKESLADSPLIFERGKRTCENGSYFLSQKDMEEASFAYEFDGTFGHYTTRIKFTKDAITAHCNCPYPGKGCRHAVAAALNALSLMTRPRIQKEMFSSEQELYLSEKEIKDQALAERKERAASETFTPIRGDMFTGDHKILSKDSRTYLVCLHDPVKGKGHCSCPDYLTNGLGTCKHIQFMAQYLKSEPGFKAQAATETLPFVDIFWDSLAQAPRHHAPGFNPAMADLKPVVEKYFNAKGDFIGSDISLIMGLMLRLRGDRRVRIRENLLKRVDHRLQAIQLKKMEGRPLPKIGLNRPLYPFQKKGVDFGALKTGVLIGDEMGLGKTAQAIAMGLVKCEIFGFSKILVITLASLKKAWKDEVEIVSRETACIIQGTPSQRRRQYDEIGRFKISHYEAVLKDVPTICRFNPDIIILDEAQRIRNFSTQTAEAMKRLPKKHAIVLTGTPLENKPQDLYSIVQFLDPYKFTPLWQFAADHFIIPKARQTSITGYKNLDQLGEKLKDILVRRTWETVCGQLPETVTSNYRIDLAPEQEQIHRENAGCLGEILEKKILTDMDMRQIQTLVLTMRMVSNSTFLVDRETQVSPKIRELSTIIDEIVIQNRRKMVIFSEWTAMTFLIARHLSEAGIGFAEVSGKIDQAARTVLAEKFANAPDCLIFLTTDAGSKGLNLSSARCMVNVELPWTPDQTALRQSRLIPRAGYGDKDFFPCHIINLIGANSIEEPILRGLSQNPELFSSLFGSNPEKTRLNEQDFKKTAEQLQAIIGRKILSQPNTIAQEIPEENPGYLSSKKNLSSPQNSEITDPDQDPGFPPVSDPQQLEAILNSGFDFITGLAQMASGQTIKPVENKKISVDSKTGQVNFTFKLPGF